MLYGVLASAFVSTISHVRPFDSAIPWSLPPSRQECIANVTQGQHVAHSRERALILHKQLPFHQHFCSALQRFDLLDPICHGSPL